MHPKDNCVFLQRQGFDITAVVFKVLVLGDVVLLGLGELVASLQDTGGVELAQYCQQASSVPVISHTASIVYLTCHEL